MKNLEMMKKEELRNACREYGIKNYSKMNNEGMRKAIFEAMEAAKPAEVEEVKDGKRVKIQKDRPEQNGIRRPSAGGKVALIWDYLDSILEEDAKQHWPLLKAKVIEMDWNEKTAYNAVRIWRKYQGI